LGLMREPAEEEPVNATPEPGEQAGPGTAAVDHGGVRRPFLQLLFEAGDDGEDVVVGRRLCRADGPLRLIGDEHPNGRGVGKGGCELSDALVRCGVGRLALRLAEAEHRGQAVTEGGAGLGRNDLVEVGILGEVRGRRPGRPGRWPSRRP